MTQNIYDAFLKIKSHLDARASGLGSTSFDTSLSLNICHIALTSDLKSVLDIGATFGFPPAFIFNLIIMHGGYFRLVQSNFLALSHSRFYDSLYDLPFPSLFHNVVHKELCAPWFTLSAQEALLDFDLSGMSVIEYGSGISTFFFAFHCFECISFESDTYSEGGVSWTADMHRLADRLSITLNIMVPSPENILPINVIPLLLRPEKILVCVDGEDRTLHFSHWTNWMIENRDQKIILIVDNSEYSPFVPFFEKLNSFGAVIYHHYGFVYGQAVGKQCTSFITFHPSLVVEHSVAPHLHDTRWGKMETQ